MFLRRFLKMKELITGLCSIQCVSGSEITGNNRIIGYLKQNGITYEIDTMGNIIFQKNGTGDKTLMLIAHYDEIGFSVKYLDENGFIYFSTIGGIDISILRGQKVVIMHDGNAINGVVGVKPIHMINQERNKNNNNLDVSDLWIDIGMTNRDDVNKFVSIGDPISFSSNFTELHNNTFTSKSIDDRVGIAALLSTYNKIQYVDTKYKKIIFVLSSQEEIGLRGAKVAGYALNPDVCIAIDVTHATDYPSVNKHKFGDIRLNKGVVIPSGSNFNATVQRRLRSIAAQRNIPFQIESLPGNSGTDISEIQVAQNGCMAGLVSIPCRYMHTPVEMASCKDIESSVEVLSAFCLGE